MLCLIVRDRVTYSVAFVVVAAIFGRLVALLVLVWRLLRFGCRFVPLCCVWFVCVCSLVADPSVRPMDAHRSFPPFSVLVAFWQVLERGVCKISFSVRRDFGLEQRMTPLAFSNPRCPTYPWLDIVLAGQTRWWNYMFINFVLAVSPFRTLHRIPTRTILKRLASFVNQLKAASWAVVKRTRTVWPSPVYRQSN